MMSYVLLMLLISMPLIILLIIKITHMSRSCMHLVLSWVNWMMSMMRMLLLLWCWLLLLLHMRMIHCWYIKVFVTK